MNCGETYRIVGRPGIEHVFCYAKSSEVFITSCATITDNIEEEEGEKEEKNLHVMTACLYYTGQTNER